MYRTHAKQLVSVKTEKTDRCLFMLQLLYSSHMHVYCERSSTDPHDFELWFEVLLASRNTLPYFPLYPCRASRMLRPSNRSLQVCSDSPQLVWTTGAPAIAVRDATIPALLDSNSVHRK
ncbi:hypothetical protein CBL_13978 [Carabus blaptoides fortunei]